MGRPDRRCLRRDPPLRHPARKRRPPRTGTVTQPVAHPDARDVPDDAAIAHDAAIPDGLAGAIALAGRVSFARRRIPAGRLAPGRVADSRRELIRGSPGMRRPFQPGRQPDAAAQRQEMVRRQLIARGVKDETVLGAMRAVPRERFVPPDLERRAYDDNALPIGGGQTISQPYIVARMSEALELASWAASHPDRPLRILDVGTGSGYQAAVLAQMGAEVISIERDRSLADEAGQRLFDLGYGVRVVVGDGSGGLPDAAPFAGIVVAAAAPRVPQPLVEQLDDDARLIVPIGDRWEQRIVAVHRRDGESIVETIEPAVFVPLVGEHGFWDR